MLMTIANLAHNNWLGWAANSGVPWLWPACETLHFIGLALLMGCIGVYDLRMMGFLKGLEIGPLRKLMPWGILGFVLNLITGAIFFAGNPYQYIRNWVFGYKLLFILLAGVNVIVYYASGLDEEVATLGAGADVPRGAKIVAAASLFLWIGVIFWGRMMPFLGNAF